MGLVYLAIAIVTEVAATLSLQATTRGRKALYAVVAVGYLIAFGMLALTLAEGVPLGVAYGIWAASGVALTAIFGALIFKQPFTWVMALGIALIMGGVLLIELGSQH
jgi:small multidrug resistance pump